MVTLHLTLSSKSGGLINKQQNHTKPPASSERSRPATQRQHSIRPEPLRLADLALLGGVADGVESHPVVPDLGRTVLGHQGLLEELADIAGLPLVHGGLVREADLDEVGVGVKALGGTKDGRANKREKTRGEGGNGMRKGPTGADLNNTPVVAEVFFFFRGRSRKPRLWPRLWPRKTRAEGLPSPLSCVSALQKAEDGDITTYKTQAIPTPQDRSSISTRINRTGTSRLGL